VHALGSPRSVEHIWAPSSVCRQGAAMKAIGRSRSTRSALLNTQLIALSAALSQSRVLLRVPL